LERHFSKRPSLLADDGVLFLQVKTMGPSRPDANYERTRAFYFARGFHGLEEFPTLWEPPNPTLQMVKVIGLPGSPHPRHNFP
jgi:hypothetical protein